MDSSKAWSKIKDFFKQNIFSHVYAFLAEVKIKRQVDELQKKGFDFDIDKELDVDALIGELEDYLDEENDRRKTIDDKAKSSLFIITISTTVILAGLNFIREGKITFGSPLTVIIVLGVVYLVLSGVTAIKALNVSVWYTFHPDVSIRESGIRLAFTQLKRLDRLHLLYEVLKLNEQVLLIRTNFVTATLVGMRNGIVLLSLAFVVAVGNVGGQVKYIESTKENALIDSTLNKDQAETRNSNNATFPSAPPGQNKQLEQQPENARQLEEAKNQSLRSKKKRARH